MKRRPIFSVSVFVLFLVALLCIPVFADSNDWAKMPVITHAYEQGDGKLSLEWEGNAVLYQIYLDGKNVATVNINSAIIDIKPGVHQITVVPMNYESKGIDTSFSLEIANIGSGSIDLASLGIDPKNLYQGTSSKTFKFKYATNPIFSASPQISGAFTDFSDCVLLSFTDKYDSDVYVVSIKSGKDVNYVEFNTADEKASEFITKANSSVTIALDQSYLKSQRCIIPELGEKYGFSVQLQRWPDNYIDGAKEDSTVLESKFSKSFEYTPYAAWKNEPTITYASQTADGRITLKWDHESNDLPCEYRIMRYDYILGIKKGETEIGKTAEKEFVIQDLMNGKYSYSIIPTFSSEEGLASSPVTAEVKNNWVAAPSLSCEPQEDHTVLLKWDSVKGIESYHITVSYGSGSLLRFVNLDFKEDSEFDVKATTGKMEYLYSFDHLNSTENGVKLKFEICGMRHAADGTEQKSAVTTQTVIIEK